MAPRDRRHRMPRSKSAGAVGGEVIGTGEPLSCAVPVDGADRLALAIEFDHGIRVVTGNQEMPAAVRYQSEGPQCSPRQYVPARLPSQILMPGPHTRHRATCRSATTGLPGRSLGIDYDDFGSRRADPCRKADTCAAIPRRSTAKLFSSASTASLKCAPAFEILHAHMVPLARK